MINEDKFNSVKIVPIYYMNIYADDKGVLNDMDFAKDISFLIEEMLLRKIKPVLDFNGIYEVDRYWFVLALIKWIIKAKKRVNEIISIVNLSDENVKILNNVTQKILESGLDILKGITIPKIFDSIDLEEA